MDYKIIIDELFNEIMQTERISLIKEGTLKGVPEKRSLYVVDENAKERFLGIIPYEMKTNTNKTIIIDEDDVVEILNKIESEYTFENLKEIFEKYKEEENNRKEMSEVNLQYLKEIQKYVIDETNGGKIPELKRHPREYYYYIDVKFNDGDLVRIHAVNEKTFDTTTFNNYMEIKERLEVSKAELTFLLNQKIKIHFDLQKKGKIRDIDNAYAKEMRDVRNSRIKVISDYIFNGKISVILKITDGYQCIIDNKRFGIGDNKSDKSFEITSQRQIETYIKMMDVKFYYVLKDEDKERINDFTDEELKELKFLFI